MNVHTTDSNSNISSGYMLLVERLNLIVLNLKYLLLSNIECQKNLKRKDASF